MLPSIIDKCLRSNHDDHYLGIFTCKEVEILLKAGVKPANRTKKDVKERIKMFKRIPYNKTWDGKDYTYGQFRFHPNGLCMDKTKSIYWCWKIFILLDGENKKRLITPHSNPMEYETPIDFIWKSPEEAEKGYLKNYDKGWKGVGSVKKMGSKEFKIWARTTKMTNKKLTNADHKEVLKKVAQAAFVDELIKVAFNGRGDAISGYQGNHDDILSDYNVYNNPRYNEYI